MALGSRFGEQVCRIAALGQQLWRTALGHNFGEQRRGTALGSSFGEQLWTAFRTSFEAASGNNIGVLGNDILNYLYFYFFLCWQGWD
jgi:hypothetical protein